MTAQFSLVLLFVVFEGLALGQFSDLAATDDGGQLYFATSLRLKSESELKLPPTSAIYRISDGRVERFTEPPAFSPGLQQYQGVPQLSGDGRVASYTTTFVCSGGSSCFLFHPTTYWSSLLVNGQPLGNNLAGQTQISRNGQYVLNFGRLRSTASTGLTDVVEIRDLRSGEMRKVAVWPANNTQTITNDGRVLGFDLGSTTNLRLWGFQNASRIATSETPVRAILNNEATWVVYETAAGGTYGGLHSFEVATGRDAVIVHRECEVSKDAPICTTPTYGFQPSISNDGTLVLYVASSDPGKPLQVWLARTDRPEARQLTSFASGVTQAVLAGFGNAVFAVTGSGQLVRIDAATGSVQELIARTPAYYSLSSLVPGSTTQIGGTRLSDSTRVASFPLPQELDGVKVMVDGLPMPLVSISPGEIWFQVPFELNLQTGRVVSMELANPSLFEGGARQMRIVPRQPAFFSYAGHLLVAHEDFRSLVTLDKPAKPGEVVHTYAVGLGPVVPEVQTGLPTPQDRLFPLADPFTCVTSTAQGPKPLEVMFAGLAPGLVGVYQVSVRMPEMLPQTTVFIICGSPDNATERHGGYIPSVPKLP